MNGNRAFDYPTSLSSPFNPVTLCQNIPLHYILNKYLFVPTCINYMLYSANAKGLWFYGRGGKKNNL